MEVGAFTQYIDIAQLVLYLFWGFFFGLIIYLRKEDKREGYPLDSERAQDVKVQGFPSMPEPKRFDLPDGRTVYAPDPQQPQPVQSPVTLTSTPGILVIFFPITGSRSVTSPHRQQQGQQLQIVSSFSLGPAPNQIASKRLRPMVCTNPASRHFRAWSKASSLVTSRPSLELISVTGSPRNMQPRFCG